MKKIILASASPRRRELLKKLGLPFIIEVSDYEEDMTLKLKPRDLVKRFAVGKAEAVAIRQKNALVIGADTVVEYRGKLIGKPYTAAKAKETLLLLSNKEHLVHSGYCVIDSKSGKRYVQTLITKVRFRKLSKKEIDMYVATKEPLHAAGAYMIQGGAASFVSHIEGDFYNVIGLSLSKLVGMLAKFGIDATRA